MILPIIIKAFQIRDRTEVLDVIKTYLPEKYISPPDNYQEKLKSLADEITMHPLTDSYFRFDFLVTREFSTEELLILTLKLAEYQCGIEVHNGMKFHGRMSVRDAHNTIILTITSITPGGLIDWPIENRALCAILDHQKLLREKEW